MSVHSRWPPKAGTTVDGFHDEKGLLYVYIKFMDDLQ